jgi:peptidoglycan/xylan/chitin deacetylase (PgdA/CDA1 family)
MSLKGSLKRTAARMSAALTRSNGAVRRVALCYHSVRSTSSVAFTPPELFDHHVAWLSNHCELVRLSELPVARTGTRPLVSITFDDGYADNHELALPILAKHGAVATFFVTTGLLNGEESVATRMQRLWGCGRNDVKSLDRGQIMELIEAGMEVGSHTHTHPNLALLESDRLRDELRVSKAILEETIDRRIDLLSYPFGKPRVHYTKGTVEAARREGYSCAAAITFRALRASDSNLEIPRFFADGDSLDSLEAKVQGHWDMIGWWQESMPLWVLKRVSPADFRS